MAKSDSANPAPAQPNPGTPSGKGEKKKSIAEWLEAPPQAVAAGLYLLLFIVASVIALFLLFPELDLDSDAPNRRTLMVPLTSDTVLYMEMDPDLAPALTDTLTVKFRFLDSLKRPIAGIGDKVASIPAETVPNGSLVLMILLAGALGASLYGLTSLVEYIGNDSYVNRWTMWYLLRPFTGAILALIFYLAGRAGLFQVVDTKDEFYGILALSALIGLFSKQALFKLSDIFDVLFRSGKEDKLKDKISTGTVPLISSVQPPALMVNPPDRKILVRGSNFANDAVLHVNGRELPTSHIGDALCAELDTSDVAAPVVLRITVQNPGPLEMFSKPYELKVESLPEQEQDPDPDPLPQPPEEEGGNGEEKGGT